MNTRSLRRAALGSKPENQKVRYTAAVPRAKRPISGITNLIGSLSEATWTSNALTKREVLPGGTSFKKRSLSFPDVHSAVVASRQAR
jgi:hypothetical protein